MIRDTALFMFGLQGLSPDRLEQHYLKHPLCAGVILFTRNYQNRQQIRDLIHQLRDIAGEDILITVDHEGGRVQRFKNEFSLLPAMANLGIWFDEVDQQEALQLAEQCAQVLAYELATIDVDFSFTPVLDLGNPISQIISDRAFHAQADKVAQLSSAFYRGLKHMGMAAVGKHFPGHGNVMADSHLSLPIDERSQSELFSNDLLPFKTLIAEGLEAIMPAHVLYPQVDGLPAGFSSYWLQHILREQLDFSGAIISDDLDMAGAAAMGDMNTRLALAAENCDLILLCNDAKNIATAFADTLPSYNPFRQIRLSRLQRQPRQTSTQPYEAAKTALLNAGLIKEDE